MDIYYCDKWSNIKKGAWNKIDSITAKKFHETKKPYTAVLSEGGKPRFLVNITSKWVSVSFLDELLRKYLQYDFIVKVDKMLFLRTVLFWEYEGDSENESKSMIFGYQENGNIAMEQRDIATGEIEEHETTDDVTRNWDTYPEFGQYLHLCREER